MPKSIESGSLSEGRSREREVFQLINRLRDLLNYRYVTKVELETEATGVLTAIWTSPEVPEGAVWRVEAKIIGRATSGGAAVATCDIYALVYRESGGAVIQEGITYSANTPIATVPGTDCDIVVSGNTVVVQVQDDGARDFSWSAHVFVIETA